MLEQYVKFNYTTYKTINVIDIDKVKTKELLSFILHMKDEEHTY